MSDISNVQGNEGKEVSEIWEDLRAKEAGQAEAPQADREDLPAKEPEADSGQPPAEGERQTSDAETPAGSETSDDIWASADPKLREAFQAERDRAAKAENVIRSNNGRWSQAQRRIAELTAQVAPPKEQAKDGEAAAGGKADQEKLNKVAEEYPEVAGPLIEVIADLRNRLDVLSTDASNRAERDTQQAQLNAAEAMAREEQSLAERHPDWLDVTRSEAFAQWVQTQPRMVHDALIRNGEGIVDGAEAAKILSDFKRDTKTEAPNPLADKRASQLDATRIAPARTGTAPAEGKGGTVEEIWARLREKERREALAKTR